MRRTEDADYIYAAENAVVGKLDRMYNLIGQHKRAR